MSDYNDYRWQPGEREQAEAELAERAARNRREETLQWCLDRQAEREAAGRTKSQPVPERAAAPAAPSTFSREWADYINDRINRATKSTLKVCMEAVGEVIGKDVVALEKRCGKLEAEIAELKDRLDQERGSRLLRAVPTAPALIA